MNDNYNDVNNPNIIVGNQEIADLKRQQDLLLKIRSNLAMAIEDIDRELYRSNIQEDVPEQLKP